MNNKREKHGLNAESIRLHNTKKVFELIRSRGPISRVDIAKQLGLSKAAITSAVDRLLKKGFLREKADMEHQNVGPKPQLLSVEPKAALFLGVDVGGTTIGYGMGDLEGQIVTRDKLKTPDTWGEVTKQVVSLFERCDRWQDYDPSLIQAIGLSVPGVVSSQVEVSIAPNIQGSDHFPIKEILEERLPVPVFVENDVNLSALGEMNKKVTRYTHLVFVNVGTGIGAGIIIDGELYHGAFNHAGEIGWMQTGNDDFDVKTDGEIGSLETKLTGPSLVERAKRALGNHSASMIKGLNIDDISPEDVFRLKDKSSLLNGIMREWIEDWSIVLNNLAAVLDPQLIVLGGGVSRSLDPETLRTLRKKVCSSAQRSPEIMISPDPEEAPLRGAAELCISKFSQWFS